MPEIDDNVLFKLEDGKVLELHQNLVRLKTREGGLLTVNIRSPTRIMEKIQEFFEGLHSNVLLSMDIGGTGDIKTYFRGVSPVLQQKNEAGLPYSFLSITLQEIKKFVPADDEPHCGCNINL
ncbi:hypothetical protein [Methanobrevibacter curvatus]|uniref:Uncharacterized protein n=1 Tax=Methanobrevibacter curvatus TaxID=49547 RepID=A0A166AML3_9EURY|nr:hypothetical protein [Methanobrevibacter curvatus]KZX12233.1 hypothetical protein MBCUR_10850 [Methanobrevibacter curvatus]